MSNYFSKILKIYANTEPFKFLRFLYGMYLRDKTGIYQAKDFALCEEGVYVEPGVQISDPKRVILREFSVIHRGTLINSHGGLHVGKYSGISYNCTIFTGDHRALKASALPFDKGAFLKPVFIDDFVMIGANVCIAGGVHVGEGAIVGIGSVLIRDVPPLAIVMGNPAKPVGYRDKDQFEKLKEEKAFQCPIVRDYEEIIQIMYRNKYKEFLSLIRLHE